MSRATIGSDGAPKPLAAYAPAVLDNFRFRMSLSGSIGNSPGDPKALVEGGLEAQTRRALENIQAVLSEVGWDFNNLTDVMVYLTTMGDYAAVNGIYQEMIGKDLPARAVVAVNGLPLGAFIEIKATAGGDGISHAAQKRYKF